MTELHDLLDRVTDRVASPDLAGRALTTARRRRLVRRGAVASVAAGVAVLGVVVVPRALDSSEPVREPINTPTPSPSTSPSPSPSPTQDAGAVAPPIGESVIQRAWDPSTAAELPYYPIDHMPSVLAPAGGASSTPGDTGGVLALSRSETDGLAVFYGERGWYGLDPVPEVGDIWASSLSRDGTRMVVVGEGGVFWCPAAEACPSWTRVEVPARVLGEDTRITWTREASQVIFANFATGYLVDLDSKETTELPYLGDYSAFDVAPDGRIVAGDPEPRAVAEWDEADRARPSVSTGDLGGLSGIVAFVDAIAATRIDIVHSDPRAPNDGDGLVALARDGLTPKAFLPFTGAPGQWVDGGQVKPVQWLNKLTVLVSVYDADQGMVHLVTWDTFSDGNLGYVTSYPASFEVSLRDLYPA